MMGVNLNIGIIFLVALLISSESRFVNKVIYLLFRISFYIMVLNDKSQWYYFNNCFIAEKSWITSLVFNQINCRLFVENLKKEIHCILFEFLLHSNIMKILFYFFIFFTYTVSKRKQKSADLVSKWNRDRSAVIFPLKQFYLCKALGYCLYRRHHSGAPSPHTP